MTIYRSLAQERHRSGEGRFAPGSTIGKVIRDAETMKRHAKYVIELDRRGDVVAHYLNPHQTCLVDCIVVLAPARFHGEYVNQAVALEIGLSRFVPYQMTEYQIEKPGSKKQIKTINPRTQIGTLPWKVVQRMLPILWEAIQLCVDRRMETWTRANLIQEGELGSGKFGYEAWLTIRIPKDQPKLHAILRLKDEQDRLLPGKTYAFLAEIIKKNILDFRKSREKLLKGKYSDELIKKHHSLYLVATQMAKNIRYKGYTKQSIAAVRSLLEKSGVENLRIFDRVCKIHKVPKAPRDHKLEEYKRLLGEERQALVKACTLRPCRVYKREQKRGTRPKRAKHAKKCFTISILGSKDHMEKLSVRNLSNRLGHPSPVFVPSEISYTPSDREETEEVDDVPWDSPSCAQTATHTAEPPF